MAGSRLSYGPPECGVGVLRGRSFGKDPRLHIMFFQFRYQDSLRYFTRTNNEQHPFCWEPGYHFGTSWHLLYPHARHLALRWFLTLVLLCSDNMFASVGNICRLEYGRCTKYLGTKYHISLGRSLSGARRDPDDCAKIKSEYDVVHWWLAARNIFFMGCH